MKHIFCLLLITALTLAAPNPKLTKPRFRNIYRTPLEEIEPGPRPRIIGGQEAKPNSIPYQAFIEIFTEDAYGFCGGSLISANYVLTAGHCGDGTVEAYITLGAHKPLTIEDTQLNILSKEIKVHENFVYNLAYLINDICVMKFPEPISFTDYIQPIPLPSRSDAKNLYESYIATVSGWGLTNGLDYEISDVLNVVNLTIISNRLCERTFGPLFPSIMCTSGMRDSGVCNGDSGGPLVIDGVQVGVVSFGVDSCFVGYPNGHSRLTRFLDWFEDNTDVIIRD